MSDDSQTQPIEPREHEIDLDIRPPLPKGKALVIVVRDKQCFHIVIDKEKAEMIMPLFEGVSGA